MKFLIIIASLVVSANARSMYGKNAHFESFKRKFGKSYKSTMEEEFRLKIFLNNLKTIADHNTLHEEGKVTFDLAINQFADLTTQEFVEQYTLYHQPAQNEPTNVYTSDNASVPDSIDWRDYGYVTPVKSLGQCACAWAWSATGALEGQHTAATGNFVSLSEQNLIDCTWSYGNEGCNGGFRDQAFQYVIDNNGIDTEASYPYMERGDIVCHYSDANKGTTASGYTNIRSGDEDALTTACGINGPIAAIVDGSHASFAMYHSGVYYEPLCSSTLVNLDVLVVGYGNEGGEDYYLVKTFIGPTWGDQGYIKMSRGKDNNCGIATDAAWPQV